MKTASNNSTKANKVTSTEFRPITTSKEHMETAAAISPATRKWLVALGMTQDILDYCRRSRNEIREEGYPIKDLDPELLEAVNGLQAVVNKYLTAQIRMSILGFGDADSNKAI